MAKSKVEERESVILENHGQKIFGILHKPIGNIATKTPGVLICHGLAGHKTGRYRLYVSLAKRLAEEGITVLRIDYRGSGDSEGEFIETTVNGVVSDTLKGLEYLEKVSSVDPARLGIFGRSFGGAVGILAASQYGHIKSIVLWAPMFNTNQWVEKWKMIKENAVPPELKEELMRVNGQLASHQFFEEFFSLNIVDALKKLEKVPILHIHGEKDSVVTIQHADDYALHRKSFLEKTKFIRLPNADHDFSGSHEQQEAIQATAQWFKSTL